MAKWAEIKCPRCAEQDALWEGMERALEESDAREARLEAKLANAVWRFEHLEEYGDTDAARDFAADALAELKGQGDA